MNRQTRRTETRQHDPRRRHTKKRSAGDCHFDVGPCLDGIAEGIAKSSANGLETQLDEALVRASLVAMQSDTHDVGASVGK